MTMPAIFKKTHEMPWIPASVLFGEKLLVDGEDVIFLKILSDRRAEGGELLRSQCFPLLPESGSG